MVLSSKKHDIRVPRKWGMRIPTLCAAAQVALSFEASAHAETHPVNAFLQGHYVEMLALVPALVLLGLLAFIVRIDPYIRVGHKRTMRAIIVLVFSLVAQNLLEYRLAMGEMIWLARTLTAICGYAIRPVILILFIRLIRPEKPLGWAWALAGVNAAVYTTALFSRICFWIGPPNSYRHGPLSDLCLWVSLILMACLIYLTIHSFHPRQRRETWLPVLVVLLIAGAVRLDFHMGSIPQPVAWLTIAIAISCVFYFIWLHLQFVREHEDALVTGQRVQQMLSQIKPHFLHNALTLIVDLCDTAPQKAKEATVKFSRYLRGNMESIDRTGPIPFEAELEHTKLYLDIEQMRFGDDLRVRYDIACKDFSLPALTVEPLAENAVRHGVREKPDGRGTVVIATRETPDGYEITVTDDGPGFDPDKLPEDGRMHVGIANVRERLRQIVDGALEYRSAPGEGTAAIIRIPKR